MGDRQRLRSFSMDARQFETLRAAVGDGSVVECDGLYATSGDADYDRQGGYTFGTPEGEWTDLDEAEFQERARDGALYVANWNHWDRVVGGEGTARRAFLRWLEYAPPEGSVETPRGSERVLTVPERYAALASGITREWGQLRVTAAIDGGGGRRYEVRHEADRGRPRAELDRYDDPHAAHELVKRDDDGRYRPLKTAPTLPTGWTFADLDGRALVETVEAVYPATVANWHREREGRLDVTHWREAAERQTGIYDVVDELPEEALEWLTEACCVDSQCLRRREWDADEETPLSTARGDGEFPCREPCSLVVAASRTWAILEQEEPRTYELELTPSEKNQLERLVEAAAEGETEAVREADVRDGANRYRARYLRAKRFDEDGNLADARAGDEE